jgi:hypothetical protein
MKGKQTVYSTIYAKTEQTEEALAHRIGQLEFALQRQASVSCANSMDQVLFLIEIKLFKSVGECFLRILTAPLALMPHSIHYFLQMVKNHLGDGLTLFHRDISRDNLHALSLSSQS